MTSTPHLLSVAGLSAITASLAAIACPPEGYDPTPAGHHHSILLTAVRENPDAERRNVDLAICLDTSGSMQGLIEAAKIKLWDIVNDLAQAKPTPRMRVALLTYGNDGHNSENGWVRVDSPFTEDLDQISKQLFALQTNGGTELVGRVLKVAGDQLAWTPSDDALKMIVVAGNESADQDQQFSFRKVCKANIGNGIMINSIYCGDIGDCIAPAWKEVSSLADGHFAAIDHNRGTVVITTPLDDELGRLSVSLNETYVPYGSQGRAYAMNQQEQDANAASLGKGVAAQRCETKGGAMYWNGQWDLVDACKSPEFKLENVKDDELPKNMQTMTMQERSAYVRENDAKRAALQAQIAELTRQRQAFVEAEMKKADASSENSFDSVIRKAIRSQALSKGFKFDDC